MAKDREAERQIRKVADRVLSLVVNSPELVAMITEREIARRISTGELVRADSLGNTQFEMIPAGRVGELNGAVDTALRHLDNGEVNEAMAVLEATIPDEEIELPGVGEQIREMGLGEEEPDDDAPEEAEEPEAAPVEPARRRAAPDEVVDEEEGDPARPLGMPDLGKKYDCQGCEAPITGEQAQRSTITCRAALCRDCVPRWDLKTKTLRPVEPAPEPGPDKPPAADDDGQEQAPEPEPDVT